VTQAVCMMEDPFMDEDGEYSAGDAEEYNSADEEEVSDGEGDYQPSKKKRKTDKSERRRKRGSGSGKLINLSELREEEAEASSGASDDEADWAEDLLADEEGSRFIAPEGETDPLAERTNYLKYNQREQHAQAMANRELVRRIEERSRNAQYLEETQEEDRSLISQQSRQPSILNKLWMVKVVPGMERQIVLQLMQKFFTLQNEPNALKIQSAIAQDHLKGYIYVEAFKDSYVREAIANMQGCFQRDIPLVSLGEMVSVLTVPKKKLALQRGDWVRVKRGEYGDDIAQVHEYDENTQQVTIKIIPRLNWESRSTYDEEDEPRGQKRPRKEVKFPARLFNVDDMVAVHGEGAVDRFRDPQSGEVYMKFEGQKFKDGFLYKPISIRALQTSDVVPTLEEMKAFTKVVSDHHDEDETPESIREREERTLVAHAKKLQRPKTLFIRGEVVQVIEGELKSMIGVVQSVNGDLINFLPREKYGLGVQSIPGSQLSKYFSIGDHVKCCAGSFQGETGLIVKLNENTATVLSDNAHKELKVLTSDIVVCTEVSTGAKLGEYGLFDLVMMGVDSAGVIVLIDNDAAHIMDTNGKVKITKVQGIKSKKDSKFAVANDSERSPVGKGDHVSVVSGRFAGCSGQVKHIYRFYAFLQDKSKPTNNGMFVVKTGDCKLKGVSQNSLNPLAQRPKTASFIGSRPSSHRGATRTDPLLNKNVRITGGPHKGETGLVRKSTDQGTLVQLSTNVMKYIQIPKEHLMVLDDRARPSYQPDTLGTPYNRGNQTPIRAATPMHSTPSADTPYAPGGLGGATPMRVNTPFTDGDTWSARDDYRSDNPYGIQENSYSNFNDLSTPNTGGHYYDTPETSYHDRYSTPTTTPAITETYATPSTTPYGYGTPAQTPGIPSTPSL